MSTNPDENKPVVQIIESEDFTAHVDKYLNPSEKGALYFLLGNDPLAGSVSPVSPALMELDFCGCLVDYAVKKNLDILLIEITPKKALKPLAAADKDEIKGALDKASKAGVIFLAGEKAIRGLKKMIEFIKDNWPDSWPF